MLKSRKLRAYVKLPAVLSGPAVEHPIHVTNVSLSGCLLRTEAELRVGDSFTFHVGSPSGRDVALRGVAVRRQEEPGGYGIAFGPLSEGDRKELSLIIAEAYDPPLS